MTPLDTFEEAWVRCDQLSVLHSYLEANVTSALRPDEILRAEWAARVSTLDLYVHELVAQGMLHTIVGARPQAAAFSKFQIDVDLLVMPNVVNFQSKIDLQIRSKLERRTFQLPDDISEGVRYISNVELWNSVALADGATEQAKVAHSKSIRAQLTQIVNRRNKIVHEADLQPAIPRTPWPISRADLTTVRSFIEKIVRFIDAAAA